MTDQEYRLLKRQLRIRKAMWEWDAEQRGYERARAELNANLARFASLKSLNVSDAAVLKAMVGEPVDEEPDDLDPYQLLALAAINLADDPDGPEMLEALRELIDDPEALEAVLASAKGDADIIGKAIRKAWDHSKHPRDDNGRFVSHGEIRAAAVNPAAAEKLRQSVTNPEQIKNLDDAISSAKIPGKLKQQSDYIPTGEKHYEQGKTFAHLLRKDLISKIKSEDFDGINDWRRRATKINHVHYTKDKQKAIAQFREDYKDHPKLETYLEKISYIFDAYRGEMKERYQDLARIAADNLGASVEPEEFRTTYTELSSIYEKAQNDIWDAIEEARDGLGGKEKGFKLGRYFKAWDHSKHPRDDHGRFLSKDSIAEAKHDPAKADALRARTTNPKQRAKLEEQLEGDAQPSQRTQRKQAAQQRREATEATRKRGEQILKEFRKVADLKKKYDPADVHALIDHLQGGNVRIADIKAAKDALRGALIGHGRLTLGGARTRQAMLDAVTNHLRKFVAPKEEIAPVPVEEPPATGGDVAEVSWEAKKDKEPWGIATGTDENRSVPRKTDVLGVSGSSQSSASGILQSDPNIRLIKRGESYVLDSGEVKKRLGGNVYAVVDGNGHVITEGSNQHTYERKHGAESAIRNIRRRADKGQPHTETLADYASKEVAKQEKEKANNARQATALANQEVDPVKRDSLYADATATQQGYDYINKPSIASRHRSAVESALAAGKPVPEAVLADYPDLAAKYGTPPPTSTSPDPLAADTQAAQKVVGKPSTTLPK
jgi:hypothetical protein